MHLPPIFVILAEAGIHGIRTIFWIPTFVGMTEGASGNDGRGVGNDSRGEWIMVLNWELRLRGRIISGWKELDWKTGRRA